MDSVVQTDYSRAVFSTGRIGSIDRSVRQENQEIKSLLKSIELADRDKRGDKMNHLSTERRATARARAGGPAPT